jgi:ribonucleoside-diphosphate reductase beta chain
MSVFNPNNKGHETGKYPIFLGDDLGLFDTVHVNYPELEKLYNIQMSQIWSEFEIDLTQDKMDMLYAPKEVTDLMVKTISWQHLVDSAAAKSITSILIRHCTNSEAEGMFQAQALFEVIHARTYSHIIKQTFVNPTQMLHDTYVNTRVLKRSEVIVDTFNSIYNMPVDTPRKVMIRELIKTMFALMGLEAISFMGSFAVTFAIGETDLYQGICKLVGLICRDEILHARMDYAVLVNLLKDPEWKEAFEELRPYIKKILDSIIEQETSWTDYLFSEGRQVVGLNAILLKEYIYYLAYPIYQAFGIQFDFQIVKELPLPYMLEYIDTSVVQTAAQELQLSNYNIGAIEDDTDDLDLENLEF